MIKGFITLLLLLWGADSFSQTRFLEGQTVFGDMNQPDPAAIFQIESTTQGFLPPRLTNEQRDELSNIYTVIPQGLVIYNIEEAAFEAWTGSAWASLAGGSGQGLLEWDENLTFVVGDFVYHEPSNQLYLCIEGHTSGATLDEDREKWKKLVYINEDDFLIEGELKVEGEAVFEDLVDFDSTHAIIVPRGTEAERPDPAEMGMIRFNTEDEGFEGFDGNEWGSIGGGGIDKWEATEEYEIDDVIWTEFEDELRIYVAVADHTASATFVEDIANWDLIADASVTKLDGEVNLEADFNLEGDFELDGFLRLVPRSCAGVDPVEGKLFYCDDLGLLRYFNSDGRRVNVGEDVFTRIRNQSGSTLTKGTVVKLTGATGGNPTAVPADFDSLSSQATLAVVQRDINNNAIGKATFFGRIRDLDTSGFSAGDDVYLDETTAGSLTGTPTRFKIGQVINSNATEGSIMVNITIDQKIIETVGSVDDNEIALFDSDSGLAIKGSNVFITDDGGPILGIEDLQLFDGNITQQEGKSLLINSFDTEVRGNESLDLNAIGGPVNILGAEGVNIDGFLDDIVLETLTDVKVESRDFVVDANREIIMGAPSGVTLTGEDISTILFGEELQVYTDTKVPLRLIADEDRALIYQNLELGENKVETLNGDLNLIADENIVFQENIEVSENKIEVLDGSLEIEADLVDVVSPLDALDIQAGNVNEGNLISDPYFYRNSIQFTPLTGIESVGFNTTDFFSGNKALEIEFNGTGSVGGDRSCAAIFPTVPSGQVDSSIQYLFSLRAKFLQGSGYYLRVRSGVAATRPPLEVPIADDFAVTGASFVKIAGDTGMNIQICQDNADNEAGDSIVIDAVKLKPQDLEVIKTKDCVGGLDCINEFSARVDGTVNPSPVSNIPNGQEGWIGDCTRVSTGVYDCPIFGFDSPPNCIPVTDTDVATRGAAVNNSETTSNNVRVATFNTNPSSGFDPRNEPFNIFCQRSTDYKPITEQGVVETGYDREPLRLLTWTNTGSQIDETENSSSFSDVTNSNFTGIQAESIGSVVFVDDKIGGVFNNLKPNQLYMVTSIVPMQVDSGAGCAQRLGSDFTVRGEKLGTFPTTNTNRTAEITSITIFEATSSSHEITLQQRRVQGSSDCTVRFTQNASSASLSVTPVDANKIPAIIKDLPDMPRADGEQTRFCTISQESSTSTPIFTSDNDCGDFTSASLESNSLYSGIRFKEGYFKEGVTVRCSNSAPRANRVVTGPAAITPLSGVHPIAGEEFVVQTRSVSTGNPENEAWNIACSGPRP